MKPCPPSSAPLWRNLALIVVYATAMGLLEAICVVYLRKVLLHGSKGPIEVAAIYPFISIESSREACTIVMLAVVGWLAGTTLATRFGFFIAAFGVWDIWYYVGLYVWDGWPKILEWDILFLLPCLWYGPVLAPVLISLSFIVSCACLIVAERPATASVRPCRAWAFYALGWTIWIFELHPAWGCNIRNGRSGELSLVGIGSGYDSVIGRNVAGKAIVNVMKDKQNATTDQPALRGWRRIFRLEFRVRFASGQTWGRPARFFISRGSARGSKSMAPFLPSGPNSA